MGELHDPGAPVKHSIIPLKKKQCCQGGQPRIREHSETVIVFICGLSVTEQKFKMDPENIVSFVAFVNRLYYCFDLDDSLDKRKMPVNHTMDVI